MAEITSKKYWSSVGCKLIETCISVKLWVLGIATYMTFQMLAMYKEIKEVIIDMGTGKITGINVETFLPLLIDWSSKILDICLAMFTGVIIVVLLSREVFKHAKISKSYEFFEDDDPVHSENKDTDYYHNKRRSRSGSDIRNMMV